MGPIAIGNTLVGTGLPVFFIAEIGVNHNGNIDLAHVLIFSVGCSSHFRQTASLS
jgi:sialic acid synthase SpsE